MIKLSPCARSAAGRSGHRHDEQPTWHAPIVKVEEACGNGYFRDGNGCRRWYGGETAHRPQEGCPWDMHFVHWANHEGGFCKSNS
jgi:hypothetical protein